MRIELSSSEVCSRVQLGNAFVFTATIVLQSQPISYNLLLHGDGKQLAISPPCDNLSCPKPRTLSSLFSMLKKPRLLCLFSEHFFYFPAIVVAFVWISPYLF